MTETLRNRIRSIACALGFLWAAMIAIIPMDSLSAGELAITPRGAIGLNRETTTDQSGVVFNILELSGIAYRGGNQYVSVMDGSDKLVHLDITLGADGALTAVNVTGGVTLSVIGDYEGIAYNGATRDTVWLVDESHSIPLRLFRLATGEGVARFTIPTVFDQRRPGLGIESLTQSPNGKTLWLANEQSLAVDGPISSPTSGTIVRLSRLQFDGNTFDEQGQFAYPVDPWHAGDSGLTTGERSGLVELVSLPDGRLLSLERSLAFAGLLPSYQSRIYEIDFQNATDVVGIAQLADQTFQPVTKRLLWSGAAAGGMGMNLEGLALGPQLADGSWSLIGVVDSGGSADLLSQNRVVAFQLTGGLDLPGIPGDIDLNGQVNATDFRQLSSGYGTQIGAVWQDGSFDFDGKVTLSDLVMLSDNYSERPTPAGSGRVQVGVAEPRGTILMVIGFLLLCLAQVARRLFATRQRPTGQHPY